MISQEIASASDGLQSICQSPRESGIDSVAPQILCKIRRLKIINSTDLNIVICCLIIAFISGVISDGDCGEGITRITWGRARIKGPLRATGIDIDEDRILDSNDQANSVTGRSGFMLLGYYH